MGLTAASGDCVFSMPLVPTPLLIWQWKTAPGKAKPSYRRCTSPKSFAFTSDNPGTMEQSQKIFETTLKTVDVTFQNLDSSEISSRMLATTSTLTPQGC